ncbi:MAG TPA: hypothetical protein VFU73_14395 [Actinocrinis sp.]|nr:hypothetical protein [Actinocrinis sp.]
MTLVASRSGRRSASAVAAWAAATAAAAGVAWLGVDSVLIPAAETAPAVLAAGASPTRTPAPAPSPSPSPDAGPAAGAAPSRSATPRGSASPTASPSASASPTDSGKLSRYETGGGVVVLSVGAHVVTLVSATPAAGYSVMNWSAPGWLRVDFTEGSTVYSVYATWNGYSPQVQVVGPN